MLHSCTANVLHKKYIILKVKNPCAGSTPGTWLFNGRKMTMENFIPIGKMSKKTRRKIEHAKRNTWGPINPITRRAESKKIYNRKKVRPEKNDFYHAEPFAMMMTPSKTSVPFLRSLYSK
jgi:hypothetical protein